MARPLIVYFSRTGENYVGGAIRRLEIGNTKIAAEMLQEITGADVFEIRPVTPYSDNYMECINEAKGDLESNARPEIQEYPEDISGYDTIYLAYPNYWGTMPMVMWTFLEHFDFSGKTIRPLCTNEGSGMGNSESDIRKLCPDANVTKGLALTGGKVKGAKNEIERWVQER